jgi:RNA polymerase sigma factor (sigma-70 family)
MKDYRIEVRVKNNLLYRLMKGKGIDNVAELSRRSGVSLPQIYNYMNLKIIPYSSEKNAKEGEFKNSVLILAEFLGVTPYEMFPIQHLDKPLLTNKAETELTFEEITQYILPEEDKPLLEDGLYGPEQIVFEDEKQEAVADLFKTLSKNEVTALRPYYGLDGPKKTLKEIAELKGITRERVRQIIKKAERKIRHPTRKKVISDFL